LGKDKVANVNAMNIYSGVEEWRYSSANSYTYMQTCTHAATHMHAHTHIYYIFYRCMSLSKRE